MTTMEDLSKTQIVLLTLLVSFITSIATGIITSSLLAQAPQSVTQTIDRVVERVVSPTNVSGNSVKEVTVVNEDDIVIAAIEKASKAVVRIKSPVGPDGNQNFYALGVILNKQGHVLSDRRDIVENSTYTVVFADGSTLPAIITKVSEADRLVMFKLIADDGRLRSLHTVPLAKADPKLGQTVIAIQGREQTAVSVSRVISINSGSKIAVTEIPAPSETQGAPLLNLSGELIGFKTSNPDLTLPPSSYTIITPVAKFVSSN